MKKRNFWAILGTVTLSAAFWACSTATLPAIPEDDDDEIAEVTDVSSDSKAEAKSSADAATSEKASSSSEKQDASSSSDKETASSDSKNPESASSDEKVSSSSDKEEASSDSKDPESSASEDKTESSSATEAVESSSSEVASSSSGEAVSSSSEHKVPENATEKNTQSITNREDVMDEVVDVPDVSEMIKSDSLIFYEKDMDFESNDYYCYDAASDGWYKISDSKAKSFMAKFIDWLSSIFSGKGYFDYSTVCDEIYIKVKSK